MCVFFSLCNKEKTWRGKIFLTRSVRKKTPTKKSFEEKIGQNLFA